MCTNYDRSLLTVFKVFETNHAKSIRDAARELGDNVFSLNLYCRPLDEFISSMEGEGYLASKEDGYILTTKGEHEREELETICQV